MKKSTQSVNPAAVNGNRQHPPKHLFRMTTKLVSAVTATVFSAGLIAGAAAADLRLSHQWSTNDVRHKMAQIVADHVKEADVDLEIKIFPSQSLFKAKEQYVPLTRGQLDMTILPLAYEGGKQPIYNLTLMPGLVKNHDHAKRLFESDFMAEVVSTLEQEDVKLLVHGYLAGGFAGKDKCLTKPEDVQGIQLRAAGKAFEEMLAGAGASITSMPSSELYNALQTDVLQGANTSSSSFVSYRIYEQVKCFTPAGEYALWFMYQPLMMNKTTFDKLSEEQQQAILEGSAKAQEYYIEEAKREDKESEEVFAAEGVEIAQMTEEDFNAWREVAKETAYKEFVNNNEEGQRWLDMALSVE